MEWRIGKMKLRLQKCAICLSAMFLIASTEQSGAFALLGPIQPWMQTTNGVFFAGDIGGPMCISNGYRWNVPVVSYGFDQSFTNYFGTNGVVAVEGAIQILNNLPPASQVVLTNYPVNSQYANYEAQSLFLYDLKSEALSLLLEHMGLASPTRNIYVLKQWDSSLLPTYPNGFSSPLSWPDGTIPEFVLQRNYDPQTLNASPYINENLYSAYIDIQSNQYLMVPFNVVLDGESYTAVADFPQSPVNNYSTGYGIFYKGLTYDDVGGLAYLLSTNNVNYETLLPSVVGTGTNANSAVKLTQSGLE